MAARGRPGGRRLLLAAALMGAALLTVAATDPRREGPAPQVTGDPGAPQAAPAPAPATEPPAADPGPQGPVTLGFAGDMHFELQLAGLVDAGPRALGPITARLREPDLMMVNLETALTTRGTPEPKLYNFRAPERTLGFLDRVGVDVVTLGNNHAVDYGPVGLRDTLRAKRRGPLPVVGVGGDEAEALAPHRVRVRGTDIAFFGASSRPDRTTDVWTAGTDSPGVATTRGPQRERLLAEVRRAAARDDVVVVYLHWGKELETCPGPTQRSLARAFARAGADVVVGTHAHVLQGAGWLGDTYVAYGLGNFLWYHDRQPASGILRVRVRDGEVVRAGLEPARIEPFGIPVQLMGAERAAALQDFEALRGCTGLAAEPAA